MVFDKVLGWQVEGMRFSLFAPTLSLSHDGWWGLFTGGVPDTITSKVSTGEYFYQGEFGSNSLELRVLPERIDWIFRPNANVSPFLPTLGEFSAVHHIFMEGLVRWLSNYESKYTRLAFAVTLLNPVGDRHEGYRELNEFLPFMPLTKGDWQDLYLQFNKPISLDVIERVSVGINRLINYSVAHMQMMSMQGNVVQNSSFYTRVDLDINTLAELDGEFSSGDVLKLSHYLMDVVSALKDAAEV